MRPLVLMLVLLCVATAARAEGPTIRPPVAAGSFYPLEPELLRTTLQQLYAGVPTPSPEGRLAAVIVPHSGYEFAGSVAAHAFRELQPGQYDRVIILAPSHFSSFEGLSIPAADAFVTPLGVVPIDRDAVDRVIYSALIDVRALHYNKNSDHKPLHENEYSIEVLLPYLQERLVQFQIVPIMVGTLNDAQGRFNANSVSAVAESLKEIVDDRTLIVVSSDFTHFGNDFSFRPFNTNIPEAIQGLDTKAFELIVARNLDEYRNYMKVTKNTICGNLAIQIMMELLPRHTKGKLLAYDMSLRHTQNVDRSVSYAALSFHEPGKPVNELKQIQQASAPARETSPAATVEAQPVPQN